MKANEMNAPDKIYIPNKIDFVSAAILKTKKEPDDITYIRKDALLEWAEEKKEKVNADDGDFSFGYASAMIGLIDKIESM